MTVEITTNELFKLAIENQDLNQSHIEKLANIPKGTLSKFKEGTSAITHQNILKIAPYLSINPLFLIRHATNPFKSNELIKIKVPGLFILRHEIFELIINYNSKAEFISLIPTQNIAQKINRIFFPDSVYALLMKDDLSNIFLIRNKLKSVFLIKQHEDTLQNLLLPIIEQSAKNKKNFIFRIEKITDENLYDAIYDWTATKKDVEHFFKK